MDDSAFRLVVGDRRGAPPSTRETRRGERSPLWHLDGIDAGIKCLFADATDEEILAFLFEQGIRPEANE